MVSQEQRILAVRSMIDAALEICRVTRIEILYELEHLLRTSAMIVEPNLEGGADDPFFLDVCWYEEMSGRSPVIAPLRFYALYPEDLGDASTQVLECVQEAHAIYRSDVHVIAFHEPEFSESRFMQGLLTLHETAHAFFALKENRVYSLAVRTSYERLLEELTLYELEKLVWRERGPSVFQSLLDEMVVFVDAEHRLRHPTSQYLLGEYLTRFPDPSDSTLRLLDQLLGPLPTGVSSDLRIGHLRIYAQLELIDRSDVSDKLTCKIGVMELLHRDISSY